MTRKLIAIIVMGLLTNPAMAVSDAVEDCAKDSYTQTRILEDVPEGEKLDVFNSKDEVVGAFQYIPQTGDLVGLYLCGSNSGYYYSDGNVYESRFSAIYNDEYDSVIDVEVDGSVVNVILKAVYFEGMPEDADYQPFSASLFVHIPEKE